jgi:hypothetical protein
VTAWTVAAVLVAAVGLAAEVRLNDGTVIEAESVKVTGSYVMLTMADGRQVAYDLASVDPDSLPGASGGSTAAEADAEPTSAGDRRSLSKGRSLDLDRVDDTGEGTLSITDEDVSHVRPDRATGAVPGEDEEGGEGEQPAGGGGGVVLQSLNTTPGEGGAITVEGEVVNRSQLPARNVRAILSVGEERAEVPISGMLMPDASASFVRAFELELEEGAPIPSVNVQLQFTQERRSVQEVERQPDRQLPGPPVPTVGGTVAPAPRPTPYD